MREIAVSTEVFSKIWSLRQAGEESEDEILKRVLPLCSIATQANANRLAEYNNMSDELDKETVPPRMKDARWYEVIVLALHRLGGSAPLSSIYRETEFICRQVSRPTPESFEETIRATLEDNSSDSSRYKRVRDIFAMSHGKHSGFWSLRT